MFTTTAEKSWTSAWASVAIWRLSPAIQEPPKISTISGLLVVVGFFEGLRMSAKLENPSRMGIGSWYSLMLFAGGGVVDVVIACMASRRPLTKSGFDGGAG